MGVFRVRRESCLGPCSRGEPRASSHMTCEGDPLIGRGRELGGYSNRGRGFSWAESWPGRKSHLPSLPRALLSSEATSAPSSV